MHLYSHFQYRMKNEHRLYFLAWSSHTSQVLLNYLIMFDIFYLVIVPADHVFPENAF